MIYHFLVVLCFSLGLLAQSASNSPHSFEVVYYSFGQNIGHYVSKRLLAHLRSVHGSHVYKVSEYGKHTSSKKSTLLFLAGNTTYAQKIVPLPRDELEPESFRVVYQSSVPFPYDELFGNMSADAKKFSSSSSKVSILASNGLPLSEHTHTNISFNKDRVHYGAVTGAYMALELLGFAFLHPMEAYIPNKLSLYRACQDPSKDRHHRINTASKEIERITCAKSNNARDNRCCLDILEEPYWPERSFHIHTQHPLELTEVLQGHDIPQFGPIGPRCRHHSSKRELSQQWIKSLREGNATVEEVQSLRTEYWKLDEEIPYCERWEDMVKDVDKMFEWGVANRLNKFEWLLLGNYKWGDELGSRMHRLRVMTSLGHEYSLMIGADVPLSNVQQHGWFIVNIRSTIHEQVSQIKERVDWIFEAGFDFMTTESGSSEFTHPECDLMLELLNAYADYVNGTWGREAGVKVHCSTGQKCYNYKDPITGDPLNFNFLPYYATKALGVFPHTIQVYGLDDPTAGAYGNQNFQYMEEYMVQEAKTGNRSVIFYPETAYWVNVDVDVPLFLPLYGQRRLHDLRRLARREADENFKIQGQMNFDSGWEWGYWLSDVVTARASWNPIMEPQISFDGDNDKTSADMTQNDGDEKCGSGAESGEQCTSYVDPIAQHHQGQYKEWEAFAEAMYPMLSLFYEYSPHLEIEKRLTRLLVHLSKEQARLLIRGEVIEGVPSKNLKKLSGIAYLSGGDTWIDLPHMLGLPLLQPSKVHLREVKDIDWQNVHPLLEAMEASFGASYKEIKGIVEDCKKDLDDSDPKQRHHPTLAILSEIEDSIALLAMRAKQVRLLYASKEAKRVQSLDTSNTEPVSSSTIDEDEEEIIDSSGGGGQLGRAAALQLRARRVIHSAAEIVLRREEEYKIHWRRVGAWRDNPTVYRYGYLWAVHSLYYWWRDQGLTEEGDIQSQLSPCYLNRMDASEIPAGWGKYTLQMIRNFVNRFSPFRTGYPLELVNCLAPPNEGYVFPRDLFKS